MRCQFFIVVVAVAALIGASPQGAGKSDQDALQGVWKVVSGEMGGKAVPPEMAKEMQFTVKGDVMHFKNRDQEESGTIKLDPAKKPKHIDITDKKDGKVMKGIYELKEDDFKICFGPDKSDRPMEFKSKEGEQGGVLILKREKK